MLWLAVTKLPLAIILAAYCLCFVPESGCFAALPRCWVSVGFYGSGPRIPAAAVVLCSTPQELWATDRDSSSEFRVTVVR